MTGSLDSYQHRARVQPAFLCLLPISVTLATTLGFSRGLISGLVAVGASTGLTYLVAVFVRDQGRRIENDLWESWGGKPTTQLLTVPITETEGALRRRWNIMSELMAELPSNQADRAPSNDEIDDYVGRLRELTRDADRFKLVATENAGYGFRRNLLGLRHVGLVLAILSAIWAAMATALAISNHQVAHEPLYVAVLLGDLGATYIWFRVINPSWVRLQAFNYARALFSAAESLVTRTTL